MQSTIRCPHDYRVSCNNCMLSKLCLPIALDTTDISRLDEIVKRGKPLASGDHLFHQKQPFGSIYAVRSGSLKSYSVSEDGKESITGFHFPGEILGIDGIGRNQHASSAIAMEMSTICEIPFTELERLSQQLPTLQRHCFQLMSHEIIEDQQLIALLSKSDAEERIATFILSLSARRARQGLSATEIWLPMSRADIGNYLGLTVETISRILRKLQKEELITVNNKAVNILAADALRQKSALQQ